MESLRINATDDTPEIVFDKEKGKFEFKGRSLPEDSADFFTPILNWLKSYRDDPNKTTEVVFNLDYFNTASSKFIQDILQILDDIEGTRIVWYYHEDDEDMEQMGRELAELVEIPFEYRSYH